ncbi:uncharacterized protein LOC135143525 [Zophobas morio]|uniref:uncharacterized protein LOC135143525 n=1 Tax=Zophobas morio TaxID=2755281 RepID=UPI0030827628
MNGEHNLLRRHIRAHKQKGEDNMFTCEICESGGAVTRKWKNIQSFVSHVLQKHVLANQVVKGTFTRSRFKGPSFLVPLLNRPEHFFEWPESVINYDVLNNCAALECLRQSSPKFCFSNADEIHRLPSLKSKFFGEEQGIVLETGGPVWCMEWVPNIPVGEKQYLTIAARTEECSRLSNAKNIYKCALIQLWECDFSAIRLPIFS